MAPRIEQDRPSRPPDFPPTGRVIPYETFLAAKARREADDRSKDGVTPPRASIQERRKKLREAIRRLPDVRKDKVRRARKRIQDGFYDRPEVLDAIVRRLLRDNRKPRGKGGKQG